MYIFNNIYCIILYNTYTSATTTVATTATTGICSPLPTARLWFSCLKLFTLVLIYYWHFVKTQFNFTIFELSHSKLFYHLSSTLSCFFLNFVLSLFLQDYFLFPAASTLSSLLPTLIFISIIIFIYLHMSFFFFCNF